MLRGSFKIEVKKPVCFEDQLKKLKSRGCYISDEIFATDVLQQINYYRLSAYFLPFKDNDKYKQGTSFHEVYRIYEFDRKLRNLILSIIEEIELMLRTQLSYYHAHKYGPLGYTNEKNYIRRHNHEIFMKIINDSIDKNRKQLFVSHHINEYDGNFPIWVIVELFTTGELSFFYSDMLRSDRKAIAKSIFLLVKPMCLVGFFA